MKDLDFDELDRAVNSLMTDASKAQPSAPEAEPTEQEKTLDITPTLDADTTPSFDKLNEATAKTAGTVNVTVDGNDNTAKATPPLATKSQALPARPAGGTTPPATRRGGRFMDVVHPSAGVKKADTPARVSRQGVTIAPVEATTEEEPVSKPASQQPVAISDMPKLLPAAPEEKKPTPLAVPSRPPVEAKAETKDDWPDPLDMAGFNKDDKDDNDQPAEDMSAVKDAAKKSAADDTASEDSDDAQPNDQPLTSPFLSDAKVEKRPLGGSALSAEAEEPSHAPVLGAASQEKKSVDDPEAQLPASPQDIEPELPEELQGDLVAVEADTTTHPQPTPTHPASLEQAAELPADEKPIAQSAHDKEEKQVPTGPTSIPQQYREEESTGDKDSGAIYDTSAYHQPLAHPAQKRSGWLVVVWIIAILLLGAGGGAALYLLGIV